MTSDAFFRMTVHDVFNIRGRGTVVTGQVEAGTLKVGDEINIGRQGAASMSVVVAGIEMLRNQITQAQAGDNVGVLLRGVEKQDVQRGDTLMGE
jgi:elongation factor Tu